MSSLSRCRFVFCCRPCHSFLVAVFNQRTHCSVWAFGISCRRLSSLTSQSSSSFKERRGEWRGGRTLGGESILASTRGHGLGGREKPTSDRPPHFPTIIPKRQKSPKLITLLHLQLHSKRMETSLNNRAWSQRRCSCGKCGQVLRAYLQDPNSIYPMGAEMQPTYKIGNPLKSRSKQPTRYEREKQIYFRVARALGVANAAKKKEIQYTMNISK